jgi:hypothetical protein
MPTTWRVVHPMRAQFTALAADGGPGGGRPGGRGIRWRRHQVAEASGGGGIRWRRHQVAEASGGGDRAAGHRGGEQPTRERLRGGIADMAHWFPYERRAPGSVKFRAGGDSPRPGRRRESASGWLTWWNSGTDG